MFHLPKKKPKRHKPAVDPTATTALGIPKYIQNPEWTETEEAKLEEAERREELENTIMARAQMSLSMGSHARGENPFAAYDGYVKERSQYFPEEKELPKKGSWILVLESPRTEYTVPPFSIWYAKPWYLTDAGGDTLYRAKIITPRGDLGLWPFEYSVLKDITKLVGREAEGIDFHFMSDNVKLDADVLHYIMSRGIPRREAVLMMLPMVNTQTLGYFKIRKEYADIYDKWWPPAELDATVPVTEQPECEKQEASSEQKPS